MSLSNYAQVEDWWNALTDEQQVFIRSKYPERMPYQRVKVDAWLREDWSKIFGWPDNKETK
jgi:hypothetical protein